MWMERAGDDLLSIVFLLVVGLVLGLFTRSEFNLKWLLISVGLLALNSGIYVAHWTFIPDLWWPSRWAWQSKVVSLAVFLGIAALPAFGLRETGVTLRHDPKGLRAVMPFVLLYAGGFVLLALSQPQPEFVLDTVAFQLTMPSLEEELFFRGVLLFALYKAFTGRVRLFGVEWGWGAPLSCIVFGLMHALNVGANGVSLEWLYFLATAVPSMAGVWVRLRTGSLLIPVLMHSVGNAAGYFI